MRGPTRRRNSSGIDGDGSPEDLTPAMRDALRSMKWETRLEAAREARARALSGKDAVTRTARVEEALDAPRDDGDHRRHAWKEGGRKRRKGALVMAGFGAAGVILGIVLVFVAWSGLFPATPPETVGWGGPDGPPGVEAGDRIPTPRRIGSVLAPLRMAFPFAEATAPDLAVEAGLSEAPALPDLFEPVGRFHAPTLSVDVPGLVHLGAIGTGAGVTALEVAGADTTLSRIPSDGPVPEDAQAVALAEVPAPAASPPQRPTQTILGARWPSGQAEEMPLPAATSPGRFVIIPVLSSLRPAPRSASISLQTSDVVTTRRSQDPVRD